MRKHSPDHGPLDALIRDKAQSIGGLIASALPPNYGFALLLFDLKTTEGRMNYISNARREDMLLALKELVAKFEAEG